MGIYNHCVNESTQNTFKVAKVHVHEEYMERDPYFDIALLSLNGNTDHFMPCCLPKHGNIFFCQDTRWVNNFGF